MSDSSIIPWSDNPNAPKIPYWLYYVEKVYFAGFVIGAVFYGIVIVLFFQCMDALLNPVNRMRGGIKWGLVIHTAAMFSFVTIYTAISLNIHSISFIDNREFSGTSTDNVIPPGPVGYQWFIRYKAISIALAPVAVMNNWLADGLLLYRCYIVYAKSRRAIIFPSIMYLACLATGIMFMYRISEPEQIIFTLDTMIHSGIPYVTISFSLNVLLTLMIVTRLVWHRRNIRNAMGGTAGAGGLYKAIITVIVESSALYLIVSLLYVGPWIAKSPIQYIFIQILVQVQVIAQFLITLRVADRRAMTGDTVTAGNTGSIRFSNQGKPMNIGNALPTGHPAGSVDAYELGIRTEATIDLHRNKDSGLDSERSLKA